MDTGGISDIESNFYLLKVMENSYVWSVKSISVMKKYNLKRHYKSRHEAKYDNIRGQKIVYYQRARNYCLNSHANCILIGI